MVTALEAIVIAHLVFGGGSLIYFCFRRMASAPDKFNFPGAVLFVLGLANPILLATTAFTMNPDSSSPDLVRAKLISVSVCAFVLALAAAAMVKYLAAKLDEVTKFAALRTIGKYLIFVLWAGASSAVVTGTIRAAAYHAGHANYTQSAALAALTRDSIEAHIGGMVRELELCRTALETVSRYPSEIRLRRTAGEWFDSAKYYEVVAPPARPTHLSIIYRYFRGVADHSPVEGAQYIFKDGDGAACEVNAMPREGERTAPTVELRTPLERAVANLPALIEQERQQPIGWTLMAGAGALQEVGLEDLKITPVGPAAEGLERILKWFSKLFLASLIIWMIATPKKQDDKAGTVEAEESDEAGELE